MGSRRIRDAFWNTLGSGAFAAISFTLLIVVTRRYGVPSAAAIGVSVTTAQILFRIGVFSVSQYQITDVDEKYSFAEYGAAKIRSTLLSFALFAIFVLANIKMDYLLACILLFLFFQLLSVDDLFQNRFFQKGRLDLAGKSKFFVIIGFLAVFTSSTLGGLNLEIAISASLFVSFLLSYIFCFRRERLLVNSDSMIGGREVLLLCLPAFASNILLTLVNSMPKYAVYYMRTKVESGYVNNIFIILSVVELLGSFIYYPFIAEITEALRTNRSLAGKILFKLSMAILGVALIVTTFSFFYGAQLLSLIYGTDFAAYTFEIVYTIGICGFFLAITSLFNWVPIIIRDQKSLLRIFTIGFLVSFAGIMYGTRSFGLRGSMIGYSVGIGIISAALVGYSIHVVRKE